MNNFDLINYQAWNQTLLNQPVNHRQRLEFIARCGLLAPSVHNTQPWKFSIQKDKLIIIVQHNLHLRVGDKTGRGLFIAVGCCLFNMEIAADYLSYALKTELKKSQEVRIIVELVKRSKKKIFPDKIFDMIFKRWSDKGIYLSKQVPTNLIEQLQDVVLAYTSANLTLEAKTVVRKKVSDLYLTAASRVSLNADFGQEISHWVRANNTRSFDGMPGFVNSLPLVVSLISPYVLRFSKKPLEIQAQADYQKLRTSPIIGYLSSKNDSIEEWLEVGKAYELVQLRAIQLGLSCTPMQAIIEDTKTAQELVSLTQKNHRFKPHIFFRLGYSNNKEVHTPRRPLEYCLS